MRVQSLITVSGQLKDTILAVDQDNWQHNRQESDLFLSRNAKQQNKNHDQRHNWHQDFDLFVVRSVLVLDRLLGSPKRGQGRCNVGFFGRRLVGNHWMIHGTDTAS